jgi:hypothetical protein
MSLRSSWVALAAATAVAGGAITQCGGVVASVTGDAGGDSPSSSSGASSGGVSGSGSGSSSGSTSSSGVSSSSGSSSGTWASCYPSDGSYLEHVMEIGNGGPQCATPPDMIVNFPDDAGSPPQGCIMTSNPCALHCKVYNGGYVSIVDEEWTTTATSVDGTVMEETFAPDGGVLENCNFSFTLTKQ